MLEVLMKVLTGPGHKHSLCSQEEEWGTRKNKLEGDKGDSAKTGSIKRFVCCQVFASVHETVV